MYAIDTVALNVGLSTWGISNLPSCSQVRQYLWTVVWRLKKDFKTLSWVQKYSLFCCWSRLGGEPKEKKNPCGYRLYTNWVQKRDHLFFWIDRYFHFFCSMISLVIVTQIYFVLLEALIGHRGRFNFNRGLDLAVLLIWSEEWKSNSDCWFASWLGAYQEENIFAVIKAVLDIPLCRGGKGDD